MAYRYSDEALLELAAGLAVQAGQLILDYRARGISVTAKADRSLVTDADNAAEAVILAGLRKLTPDAVIIAEEEVAAGRIPALDGKAFWLVDPLDGTKEFIKRNGEFTVNIALVEDGRPILGIVLAPATETLWRGAKGLGADKREGNGAFTPMSTRTAPAEGLTGISRPASPRRPKSNSSASKSVIKLPKVISEETRKAGSTPALTKMRGMNGRSDVVPTDSITGMVT